MTSANAYPDGTESLCPVCLTRIKARREARGDDIYLVKECKEHGSFSTIIWRGKPSMAEWQRPKEPVHPAICYGTVEKGCPFDCGLCELHRQLPCSVLLEVTDRCNLRCPVCFADSGRRDFSDLPIEKVSGLLEAAITAVGPTNLQLSGGEPTLRDDLPEIVEAAKRVGYSFIQVNTNGLRLAVDKAFVKRLRISGLASVFLQFDGVTDEVYLSLRGRPLLDQKLQAIKNCEEAGLGVVLVPTLIRGLNTDAIGDIVRQGLKLAPTVRGLHFQPISYFGRYPEQNTDETRFTLPELMRTLEEQTGGLIRTEDFSPPGTEHAHCSFHATYIRTDQGTLKPVGSGQENTCCSNQLFTGGVQKTIETVSRRWRLPSEGILPTIPTLSTSTACCGGAGTDMDDELEDALDLDAFLHDVATRSFTVSAMAFQDADNLDLERLQGCCISVISPDGKLIPFCAYNLTSRKGESLYRLLTGV